MIEIQTGLLPNIATKADELQDKTITFILPNLEKADATLLGLRINWIPRPRQYMQNLKP